MKATILVRYLVKLIAKHGDLDVRMCVSQKDFSERDAELKCVDEKTRMMKVTHFELYGEEK